VSRCSLSGAAIDTALLSLSLGMLFVACIMVRSYWNQRRDYVRTPSGELVKNPARARITGLVEVSFTADVEPPGAAARGGQPSLAAWYAPPRGRRAAVVLVHGVYADRCSLLFETRRLAHAGFGVLALDLPGQGASGGRTEWGVPERRAISAAVDWLGRCGDVDPVRIGAFGMSMGAYVLAQAAVADQRIGAVALAASPNDVVEFNWLATRRWGWLSQYPTYWALRAGGTPLTDCPKDIVGSIAPRPLLIVQGDRDALVPEWMAHQLYAAAREPKELYIVRGAHHADYAATAPVDYGARLVDFFERSLTRERPAPPQILPERSLR
jgi:dipeptidyl aminopeptidase/acylaminoacyl peptidase